MNTAASKAVQDCRSILSDMGYTDHSIEDVPLGSKFARAAMIKRMGRFFSVLKQGSIVAVQFPLLSGNMIFKYFIKAAQLKKVKFFCVVHDLQSLRYPENADMLNDEISILNCYDSIIVHGGAMKEWLENNGLKVPVVVLSAFDYLIVKNGKINNRFKRNDFKKIVYAGNLEKSRFIYMLDVLKNWQFNLYGPNYLPNEGSAVANICWNGIFSPDEIVTQIKGSFGLVWDGNNIDRLDNGYGNYLRYNYPHKLSLYIAAGLPVIVPRESAAAVFVTRKKIGIVIDNLLQLENVQISQEIYGEFCKNVSALGEALKTGKFFQKAVLAAESAIIGRENFKNNPITVH